MTLAYIAAPIAAYVAAGALKALLHALRSGSVSLRPQGLGGFPSTHAATASAPLFAILLHDGWSEPAAGVALAVAMLVILDALDLRRRIGTHAVAINELVRAAGRETTLRERIGHTLAEVAGGLFVGFACAAALVRWA